MLTLAVDEGAGSLSGEESAGVDLFWGLGCLGEDLVHFGEEGGGGGEVGGEGGAAGVGG